VGGATVLIAVLELVITVASIALTVAVRRRLRR
jgi:hypothetical protein